MEVAGDVGLRGLVAGVPSVDPGLGGEADRRGRGQFADLWYAAVRQHGAVVGDRVEYSLGVKPVNPMNARAVAKRCQSTTSAAYLAGPLGGADSLWRGRRVCAVYGTTLGNITRTTRADRQIRRSP